MVTVRSLYSFDQFEKVMQKFAHEVAIDAVTNLNQGRGRIQTTSSNEFERVETEQYTFSFYASRIGFLKVTKTEKGTDYFGFDIEEKEYSNSNHRTKISYTVHVEGQYVKDRGWVESENRKEKDRVRGEEINALIEKLMQENGIIPVARFNLEQMKKMKKGEERFRKVPT
jgi:hypothetical protein